MSQMGIKENVIEEIYSVAKKIIWKKLFCSTQGRGGFINVQVILIWL